MQQGNAVMTQGKSYFEQGKCLILELWSVSHNPHPVRSYSCDKLHNNAIAEASLDEHSILGPQRIDRQLLVEGLCLSFMPCFCDQIPWQKIAGEGKKGLVLAHVAKLQSIHCGSQGNRNMKHLDTLHPQPRAEHDKLIKACYFSAPSLLRQSWIPCPENSTTHSGWVPPNLN